jgi:hypothetical protein
MRINAGGLQVGVTQCDRNQGDDAALKKYQQISKAPTIGSMATYG